MKIYLYAPCWNDEPIIPYFIAHYANIADRIFVYDDGSTDRSLELLAACPKVEVRRFVQQSDAHCYDSRDLWEHAWKEHRDEADWVIASNLDEHLDHPDLRGYLKNCFENGISVVPTPGYDMVAEHFPDFDGRLCDRIRRGFPADWVTKTMVFRPADIVTMNYTPGRHAAYPEGRVRVPAQTEVRILHYKYLGFDYVSRRHAELAARLRPGDRERGMGHHYDYSHDKIREVLKMLSAQSVDVDSDDPHARLLELCQVEALGLRANT